MRQNNPASADGDPLNDQNEYFDSNGHVRNICFVWPDGRTKFRNYAYLIGGDYLPNDGSITLIFTSDRVLIKGANLGGLYEALLSHSPSKIVCIDERYNLAVESDQPLINHIEFLDSE